MSRTNKDTKLRELRRTAVKQRALRTGINSGSYPITSEQAREDKRFWDIVCTTPGYGKRDRRHSAALRKGACQSRKKIKRHDKHSENQKAKREIVLDVE